MKKIKITLVTVLLLVICGTVWAQPSWNLNPNQYVYSMTLTGKVTIDGAASIDENDIVAAFIDGECRGIVNVAYQNVLDDYFVFLMIYSNDAIGTVSLKIYDASANKEIEASGTFEFEVNGIVGSVSTPYNFDVQTKVYEAKILSFSVPNQVGNASIGSNSVKLTVPADTDLSDLKPRFTLSEGAKAYVGHVKQTSGSSSNDYRTAVTYKIKPQLGDVVSYSITISKNSTSSTSILLSASNVMENAEAVWVGKVQVQSNTLGNTYTLKLVDDMGTQNDKFYLNGHDLYAVGPLNFEEQSQYKINLKVDNNKGVALEQLFNISVSDENDPPTNISVSSKTLSETTLVNKIVALLNVDDEDNGDVHTFELKNDENVDNSYFSILGDSLMLVKSLSEVSADSATIVIIARDSNGASVEKSWSFNFVDINFAPEIQSTPLNYAIQNQVYVYPLQINDNEDDPVTFSFDGLPSWLVFNEQTMLISGVPNNEHVGLVQFTIKVSDGNKEVIQPVLISVLNVNDAPEINQYPATQYFRSGKENSVSLSIDCIIDPDFGDKLTFSLSAENNAILPTWLKFDPLTLTMTGIPTEADLGSYSLKLSAIDKGRLKEWVVFSLEVTLPTAIDYTYSNSKFEVYPNPTQKRLCLGVPQGEVAEISINNLHGQIVKKLELNGGTLSTISVEDLIPGIYLVKFHQGKNTIVEQIIKQ